MVMAAMIVHFPPSFFSLLALTPATENLDVRAVQRGTAGSLGELSTFSSYLQEQQIDPQNLFSAGVRKLTALQNGRLNGIEKSDTDWARAKRGVAGGRNQLEGLQRHGVRIAAVRTLARSAWGKLNVVDKQGADPHHFLGVLGRGGEGSERFAGHPTSLAGAVDPTGPFGTVALLRLIGSVSEISEGRELLEGGKIFLQLLKGDNVRGRLSAAADRYYGNDYLKSAQLHFLAALAVTREFTWRGDEDSEREAIDRAVSVNLSLHAAANALAEMGGDPSPDEIALRKLAFLHRRVGDLPTEKLNYLAHAQWAIGVSLQLGEEVFTVAHAILAALYFADAAGNRYNQAVAAPLRSASFSGSDEGLDKALSLLNSHAESVMENTRRYGFSR